MTFKGHSRALVMTVFCRSHNLLLGAHSNYIYTILEMQLRTCERAHVTVSDLQLSLSLNTAVDTTAH